MSNDDLTPVRQQYLEIKSRHPNEILFFRLGDFYETFDEDAVTTARELDITLTSRPVGKGARVPLAGIPYHAVENYLARMIEKGYHVAICEQVGDQPIKGIFPREVVRIVIFRHNCRTGIIAGRRQQLPGRGPSRRRVGRHFVCGYHHRRVCRYPTRTRSLARRIDRAAGDHPPR